MKSTKGIGSMEHWVGEGDRYVLDLDDVREVHIRVIAGDVAVGGTPGPSRLEVECVEGDPIHVLLDDGVLVVEHRQEEPARLVVAGRRPAPVAGVSVTVPPGTPVDVRTVTAPILAAGLAADVDLKTVTGEITCSYLAGSVSVGTVSGAVEVDGVSGGFRASTVSGEITVNAGCVADLAARTLSGDVTVDLDVKPEGTYQFSTMSGNVGVRVPDDSSLSVDATTMSGRLRSMVDLRGERSSRRKLRGRLGTGEARLRAHTLSGDFVLLSKAAAREIEAAV